MYEVGHPKLVLRENPKGESGEGGGAVQDGGYMYICMYGKNHHNIVK